MEDGKWCIGDQSALDKILHGVAQEKSGPATLAATIRTYTQDGGMQFGPGGVKWLRTRYERASKGYLEGAVLKDARLKERDMSGLWLVDADLRGANLEGANLSGSVLDGANMTGALLSDALLRETRLTNANVRKAVLYHADLSDAQLDGADLSGALYQPAVGHYWSLGPSGVEEEDPGINAVTGFPSATHLGYASNLDSLRTRDGIRELVETRRLLRDPKNSPVKAGFSIGGWEVLKGTATARELGLTGGVGCREVLETYRPLHSRDML